MSRPRISACLIVKDEEKNLADCLSSIRGHVDEIIVVDTGSTDRTREVAVQHGANVYQFDQRNHPEAFFLDSFEEGKKFGAPGAPEEFTNLWALGDFAAARNESFKHATGDYLYWLDADDVIEEPQALREVVDEMEREGCKIAFLPYHYAVDHLGNVYYRQWRERVIKRGSADWVNPVHEVLMPREPVGKVPKGEYPRNRHQRKADRKGIAHRNYKILLREAKRLKAEKPGEPLDPRILFYLGQEARFVEPQKAVGFYNEYLQTSGWAEERAAAHCALGTMLELGILASPQMTPERCLAQANLEYSAAAAEMPENPEGLFGLARVAYLRKRWPDCIRFTEAAFKVGNTDTMLGTNPQDRLYRPHIYLNYAYAQIGRLEEALASCRAGLAAMPHDPGVPGGAPGMLKVNEQSYVAAIERREAAKRAAEKAKALPPASPDEKLTWFSDNEDVDAPPSPSVKPGAVAVWSIQLWKQIIAEGDGDKARRFLEAMPHTVTAHPAVRRMFDATERRFPRSTELAAPHKAVGEQLSRHASLLGAGEGLDVVFWLGAGPEPWTPNTPNEKGLGGSETAAIEMARHLARLGHRCVVYAEAMGTFDGVEYRHSSAFRGGKCDVFIASRAPGIADAPIEASIKLLWVHDIHVGAPSSPDLERLLLKFDKILCLSEWHKRYFLSVYPTVHPSQVVVTRNGIDPMRFKGPMPTKRNSMVFSSSPNRGLQWLAPNFQHIRARVPDAELHVYYGFDTWETMARRAGAHQDLAHIEEFKRILPPLGQSRDGIFNHGKRPQSELAEKFLESKVWPYLTGFTETSCITAMEAMAAGCVPVCSALAALPETVGPRGILIPNLGDDANPNFDASTWLEAVVKLLTDESTRKPLADLGRRHALENLSWEGVAREWDGMFRTLISDADRNPLPMWRSA